MSKDGLIGYTGFVGQTLLKQRHFDALYRSINIDEIIGCDFDTIVCAGAPAVKWLANKEPDSDKKNIENLIFHLSKIRAKKFILISTVDVFSSPNLSNEETFVNKENLHAYGLHRRLLEEFVEKNFDDYLIVRLPGLVGPGLKKNVIYDFLNNNNLSSIDSRSVFQFYPMVNLWQDIEIAIKNNLKIIHLTSEPIGTAEIADKVFGIKYFQNEVLDIPPKYDFQTNYVDMYEGKLNYQYSKKEVLMSIRAYAQSEIKGMRL
ncbi:TPA: NAD(P)-dependent oxidoreductase [Vibrio cholerae]|nr:NAD(P)-dependent oxidoreductase [Vibrio cholerae]